MAKGFPLINSYEGVCNGFLVGKHLERRYEDGRGRRDSYALDLVQNDVSVPVPTTSMNGSR